MEPHEILPAPESTESNENFESVDGYNEAAADKAVESDKRSKKGTSALAGVAVDDAQTQLQSAQGQAASSVGSTAGSTVQVDIPEIADDIDLIEKEWVLKAKAIVENTTGDPYVQNKQINKMKVEYIKKRYNKDIKYSEE